QTVFPGELSQATSLKQVSGKTFDLQTLLRELRAGLLNGLKALPETPVQELTEAYNALLYHRNRMVNFERMEDGKVFEARVSEVEPDGQLVLLTPTGIEKYTFGTIRWLL